MGYFNHLIKQSSLKIKKPAVNDLIPNRQVTNENVKDISVQEETVAPTIVSNQPVMERESEVNNDHQMDASLSGLKQPEVKKNLSAQYQEVSVKNPIRTINHEPLESEYHTRVYREDSSEKKVTPFFVNQDKVMPIENTEIKYSLQPEITGSRVVNKSGRTTINEIQQSTDGQATIKEPMEIKEMRSMQSDNNEYQSYEDKNLMSSYVFEQVRNWVAGDDQQLEPETISNAINAKNLIDYPDQSTAIPAQQQPINNNHYHQHVEQQLVKSLEQDVQLSIGKINVVVEAPQATRITQAPPASGQTNKREKAPSFLNWQRHYLNY